MSRKHNSQMHRVPNREGGGDEREDNHTYVRSDIPHRPLTCLQHWIENPSEPQFNHYSSAGWTHAHEHVRSLRMLFPSTVCMCLATFSLMVTLLAARYWEGAPNVDRSQRLLPITTCSLNKSLGFPFCCASSSNGGHTKTSTITIESAATKMEILMHSSQLP